MQGLRPAHPSRVKTAACRPCPLLSCPPACFVSGLTTPLHCCRGLRQLTIAGCLLNSQGMAALRPLSGLTALHLPGCGIEDLPHGPYLLRLLRCGCDLLQAGNAILC